MKLLPKISRLFTPFCRTRPCLFALIPTLLASGLAHSSDSTIEFNEFGNPVNTAVGEKLIYTQAEISAARSAQSAASDLLGAPLASASGLAEGDETNLINFDLVWLHSVWGSNLGESGITAVDLEGDGSTEIVLGTTLSRNFGRNKNWHVLRYEPSSGNYETVFTSNDNPDYSSDNTEINAVNVFKLGGKQKILVGYSTGRLLVYDGATRVLLRDINVSSQDIRSLAHADGDNDGGKEIVVATDDNTYFLNPLSFEIEGDIPVGGSEMSVGNVDNDPELEIVFVEGPIIEYNGISHIEEWDFSEFTPGRWLELGDLDGDGIQELVVARSWHYIDILDAQNRTPLRQIETSTNISQLKVVDVTGDHLPEILYGDAQHGEVHAHDGISLTQLWELDNPTSGAPGIEVADVDDDGQVEVIWGSGSNSTAPDHLSVHDLSTLAREFISFDEGGPFRALALGNVDDDAEDEFVFAPDEGDGYDNGLRVAKVPLHVISSVDFSQEWNSVDDGLGNRYSIYDIAIGDIDGSGTNEIVTTGYSYGGVSIIDAVSKTLIKNERVGSDTILSIALADFENDDQDEIVAVTSDQLHIVDSSTLDISWSSIVLAGSPYANSVTTSDLSGDGLPDIIASIERILGIEGVSKIYRQTADEDYGGFAITENIDGTKHIWAGTDAGLLARIDTTTLEREIVGNICNGNVNSVKASDSPVFADSIQFACHDSVGIWGIPEEQVIWRSPTLGTNVGTFNNMVATEQDGKALIMVGTGYGVYAFRGLEVSNRDIDDDGMPNHLDNCPKDPNPNQDDLDQDGIGDACNDVHDSDGDEWSDTLDNCFRIPNPGQEDSNNNGKGDVCEGIPGC